MFKKEPKFLQILVNYINQNKYLKKILLPFRYFYRRYKGVIRNNRRKTFKRYGVEVLSIFDKCLTSHGIQYSLAFGTMLGAVREKGLIKHDLDIDVVLWSEDYTSQLRDILQSYGFKLVHELLVDNGKKGREETYILNGVTIDLFYIYPPVDEFPYCCDFFNCDGSYSFQDSMKKYGCIKARRLQLPWKKEFIRVPFENLSLPICSNAHEILSFRYGEDYLIPNPKWNYLGLSKYVTIWEEEQAIMTIID